MRTLNGASKARGMALVEVLIYVTLFVFVAGMAFAVFYHAEEQSRFLRQSADELSAALDAGERWRADVRGATAESLMDDNAESGIRLIRSGSEVRYFVRDQALWRQVTDPSNAAASPGRPVRVLPRVQASRFSKEDLEHVTAWRWTVELRRHRAQGGVRPLLTFTAVPHRPATRRVP